MDRGGKESVISADLTKDTLEFEVDTEGINPVILIELAGSGSRQKQKNRATSRRTQSANAGAEIVVGSGAVTLDPAVYLTDWATTEVSVVVRDESGVSCASVKIELEWTATGNALVTTQAIFCA